MNIKKMFILLLAINLLCFTALPVSAAGEEIIVSNRLTRSELTAMLAYLPEFPTPQPENLLKLTIGSHVLWADWADNSSAQALKDRLKEGPLTIHAQDYGNFEKVGPLGFSLPTNDEYITTQAGDLILYQGDNFTLYYAENTWKFTRLGKLRDITAAELREILGTGNVDIILSNN